MGWPPSCRIGADAARPPVWWRCARTATGRTRSHSKSPGRRARRGRRLRRARAAVHAAARCRLSHAGFTATKLRVIDTLGMGSNAKIHIEVAEKTWAKHGFNGVAYTSHDSFDVCWDDSVPLGPRRSTRAAARVSGCERRSQHAHRRCARTVTRQGHQLVPRSDRPDLSRARARRSPAPHTRTTGFATPGSRARTRTTGRPVRDLRRDRGCRAGTRPFRRRAHVDQQPGIPRRCCRNRRPRGEGDRRAALALTGRRGWRCYGEAVARCRARYVLAFSREPHTRIEHQQLRPFLEWS